MLRIRNLRCLFLSSWFRQSHNCISHVLPNPKNGTFSRPTLYCLINTGRFSDTLYYQDHITNQSHPFSTITGTILVRARDPAKLSTEIQNAVDEHRYHDAWRQFEQHIQMEGFPRKTVVNKLLISFAETSDPQLLDRAFRLVEKAFDEGKQTLFEKETLLYLSLALSRCGFSVPASIILRKLVGMGEYPPVSAWTAVLAHMSQSSCGAYLAAELILEIGYLFQDNRVDPRKKSNAPLIAMKPNTLAFNIVLAGCILFGASRKAEELLDMKPRIGVRTDATLLTMMAQIYERNGTIEELKKLKRYIDEAHDLDKNQLKLYYDCLLSCYLKFGDLDSVSSMVLQMHHKAKEARNSLAAATLKLDPDRKVSSPPFVGSSNNMQSNSSDKDECQVAHFISFVDFCRDRNFLHLEGGTKEILNSMSLKLQNQTELVTIEYGVLQPTEETYVKLCKAFLECGKIKELADFLIKAEKGCSSSALGSVSVLVNVVNSCISLGWLDQAHDLLDEMRFGGIRVSSTVYSSLLKAYCKANKIREVTSLLKEIRKDGIQLDGSCYEALIQSRVLQKDTHGALDLFKEMKEGKIPKSNHREFEGLVESYAERDKAGFMSKLLQEIKDGQRVDSGVHDWNNVIRFFSKKRLMQDAEKALKKMRSLGHTPNAQTFHSMVTGYAAIGGKYIEVAELWGEMKSLAGAVPLKFDQELLDSVLYTFVRGGFFARANEVVEMMEKGKMFVDKYKYRTLFLKYHKTLYKKGKAPKFETESQMRKRDAALSFKSWVGLF